MCAHGQDMSDSKIRTSFPRRAYGPGGRSVGKEMRRSVGWAEKGRSIAQTRTDATLRHALIRSLGCDWVIQAPCIPLIGVTGRTKKCGMRWLMNGWRPGDTQNAHDWGGRNGRSPRTRRHGWNMNSRPDLVANPITGWPDLTVGFTWRRKQQELGNGLNEHTCACPGSEMKWNGFSQHLRSDVGSSSFEGTPLDARTCH